ncbi:MAG TPA: response regulator [Draconibacterium sp.]|nr:response regulator [Draconibacterium sp.]
METVSKIKTVETNSRINSIGKSNYSFEVVLIEDNHLLNTILSKALDSTINTIHNLKKILVKFTSFQNGSDFLNYLKNREFCDSKLIVFSDYYLEENMNGGVILRNIKQKCIDSTVIIMSDSSNKQIPIDTVNMGAHCFLQKDHKTPVICSEMLFQMVD